MNIIKVMFTEINYSCSEKGLSTVESAVWKGGQDGGIEDISQPHGHISGTRAS